MTNDELKALLRAVCGILKLQANEIADQNHSIFAYSSAMSTLNPSFLSLYDEAYAKASDPGFERLRQHNAAQLAAIDDIIHKLSD